MKPKHMENLTDMPSYYYPHLPEVIRESRKLTIFFDEQTFKHANNPLQGEMKKCLRIKK